MTLLAAIPTLDLGQVTGIGSALSLFLALCIGHSLADFPLQGDFLARGKNRNLPCPVLADDGQPPKRVWIFCLTAHSLIHAGFVWIVTGSVILGVVEFALHWLIDALKSDNLFGFEFDQGLHIACKAIYVGILWAGLSPA